MGKINIKYLYKFFFLNTLSEMGGKCSYAKDEIRSEL